MIERRRILQRNVSLFKISFALSFNRNEQQQPQYKVSFSYAIIIINRSIIQLYNYGLYVFSKRYVMRKVAAAARNLVAIAIH